MWQHGGAREASWTSVKCSYLKNGSRLSASAVCTAPGRWLLFSIFIARSLQVILPYSVNSTRSRSPIQSLQALPWRWHWQLNLIPLIPFAYVKHLDAVRVFFETLRLVREVGSSLSPLCACKFTVCNGVVVTPSAHDNKALIHHS